MALRISSLQPLLRRHAGTEAISRLQLDINAHHHADQQSSPRDPAPPLSKSSSAQRGESLRGDVTLPRELLDAVDLAIAEADDNPALRISALDLYAHLRSTAPILPAPSSYRDRQALSTTYDAPTSLAYLAGLMPSIYGATLHALTMTRDRLAVLGEWEPERMVDWGSGTGSAAWAFGEVWGGGGRTYVGLDASKAMVELSSSILGALPNRIGEGKLEGRAYQLAVPASDSALAKLQLGRKTSVPEVEGGKRTVAIAAFSLGDLGTKERRKDVVRCMWESGAEVLVVVERGTPGGSRMVLEAREQLLGYGRRSLGREETVEGEIGPEKGCFVLAPCPHDGDCPLHHSTKSYCHFSQRVRSPPFLRHTKHTTRGEDDAKFSYVVIRRGLRPAGRAPQSIPKEADAVSPTELEISPEVDAAIEVEDTAEGNELAWPRLVSPPLKRSGHIILEVCTSSGQLERHTIPKSQGRQEYYDARKVAWGDSFPHAPKNGAMPAPAGKEEVMRTTKDKFGEGKSKVRSKKAERGTKWKEEPTGRAARKRGGEKGGAGAGGEVTDYELEIGPDGQLRIVN